MHFFHTSFRVLLWMSEMRRDLLHIGIRNIKIYKDFIEKILHWERENHQYYSKKYTILFINITLNRENYTFVFACWFLGCVTVLNTIYVPVNPVLKSSFVGEDLSESRNIKSIILQFYVVAGHKSHNNCRKYQNTDRKQSE